MGPSPAERGPAEGNQTVPPAPGRPPRRARPRIAPAAGVCQADGGGFDGATTHPARAQAGKELARACGSEEPFRDAAGTDCAGAGRGLLRRRRACAEGSGDCPSVPLTIRRAARDPLTLEGVAPGSFRPGRRSVGGLRGGAARPALRA